MNDKSSHLIERAAAQLLKVGKLDGSVAQLLEQDKTVLPPGAAPPSTEAGSTTGVAPASPVERPASVAESPKPAAGPATHQPAAEAAPIPARPASRIIDISALERAGMIDWSQARSRITEEFRISQRQILRTATSPAAVEQGNGNLIMVTSSRPGEGKSFIALNLAASIARQRDHDVLLVDIDYKQDSIGTSLGLAGARGLLDLVTDPTLEPDQLIVKTGLDNFSILPIGQHGERSPELFASKQATRLIQSLARRYSDRLVILDAPPCLATSEPGVLAPIVGQVVMVIEAGKTQREEVEAAIELIQSCPTITLLLNKVQLASRYSFGAYSSSYSLPYTS